LVAFREKDANGNGDAADELPFSTIFSQNNAALCELLSAHGIQTTTVNYILQAADGKVGIAETTENYKAYLKFLNKLYKEQLLDQESFVQTSDEFRAKAGADRVGFFGDAAPFVAAGKDVSHDASFLWMGALTSESNSTPTVAMASLVGNNVLIALSAKTAYPEAAVRLVDYFYTAEGAWASRRGFADITFDWKEIEGIPGSKVAEMRKPDGYDSAEKYRYTKAVINNAFMLLMLSEGTQYKVIEEATDDQLGNTLLPKYGWAVLIQKGALGRADAQKVDTLPAFTYTAEESQTATALQNDVRLYLQSATAQFITGETDIDAGWENHLKTLDQIGLTKLLAIEQAAYDRMTK
jgi:putative aldouronate transport system substrate-binding protein